MFYLRLLIVVVFVISFTAACAETNRATTDAPDSPVGTIEQLPEPTEVPRQPDVQEESDETRTPQPTAANSPSGPYFDCTVNAEENAVIAVTIDTLIRGDFVLESGDEIAVFNPDGDICAGMEVWTGQNIVITAWGDDSQTDEIDGLVTGDPLHFRIWDDSLQTEYQVSDVNYEMGDGLFVKDGIYIVGALTIENQ